MIGAAAHNDADWCHICSTASTTTISHVDFPVVNHDNTKQSIIQRLDEHALNNDTIRPSSLRSVDRFPRWEAWTETRRRVPVHFHQAADPFRLKRLALKRNPSHHPHSNTPTRQWERLPRLHCGRSRRSCSTRPDAEVTDLSDDV